MLPFVQLQVNPTTPSPQTEKLIDSEEGGGWGAVIMEGLVARDDLATPAASQYSTGVNVSQYSE